MASIPGRKELEEAELEAHLVDVASERHALPYSTFAKVLKSKGIVFFRAELGFAINQLVREGRLKIHVYSYEGEDDEIWFYRSDTN